MPQIAGLQFGSGIVLANPNGGNLAANPSPMEIGVVQNVKLSLDAELKTLFGQNQWALDSAVGKRSIKGTVEFAQLSNFLLSQLFFADPITTGYVATAYREVHTIPATPYEVTVTNSAEYVGTYAVVYALTGVPPTLVASGPTTGQYSVAAGVYTFAAADTTLGVLITYTYTVASGGDTMAAGNHAMGYGPLVSLDIVFPYDGIGIGFNLPNARLGKIDMATKLDDYNMITTDFEAFAGSNNNPFNAYQAW